MPPARERAFAVGPERQPDVALVVQRLGRCRAEQRELLVQHVDALGKGNATQIVEGGDEPSRDLWRARAREPDLDERKPNVVVPAHRLDEQTDLAVVVPDAAVGQGPARELPEDVVQSVDRLDGGGGVLEGRVGERSLRDVDEEPQSVGDVLVERRFELQAQRREECVLVQVVGLAVDDEQRAACRDEGAQRRDELERMLGGEEFVSAVTAEGRR